MPKIVVVAAMSLNGCIGANGTIPWHIPADLRRFRSITINKPIIMGRKTWESLPRVLDYRQHIVLTSCKSRVKTHDSVIAVSSPAEALEVSGDAPEVCIVGGSKIYGIFLPQADIMHLTYIEDYVYGDTFFPQFSKDDWLQIMRADYPGCNESLKRYSFRTYVRKKVQLDGRNST